jgi:hypothetical protein
MRPTQNEDHPISVLTRSSLIPRLRTVSIIPGMENLAPDLTESRIGTGPPPKRRPVFSSSRAIAASTSTHRSSGTWPALIVSRQTSVVMVKPGGTGRPSEVIRASPAPFPPSRSRSEPSVAEKSKRCGKSFLFLVPDKTKLMTLDGRAIGSAEKQRLVFRHLLLLDFSQTAGSRIHRAVKSFMARMDEVVIPFLRRWGIPTLRNSLAVVFIWFGALKVFGVSPVVDLVASTVYWVDPDWFVPALGVAHASIQLRCWWGTRSRLRPVRRASAVYASCSVSIPSSTKMRCRSSV